MTTDWIGPVTMSDPVRPRTGRPLGSRNSAMQARAVRTREAIIAVAAQHFDTDGYGNTSVNTIIGTGDFAKGAIYYHFPTKETMAQQLVSDWNVAVAETVSEVAVICTGRRVVEQLTAIFISLAGRIAVDTGLRAGMKLTLEPSIDDATAFTRWVDSIGDIVESAITDGELVDTSTTRRLAWNLCAGVVGIVHASVTLRDDVDLTTRIHDMVAAHLHSALA